MVENRVDGGTDVVEDTRDVGDHGVDVLDEGGGRLNSCPVQSNESLHVKWCPADEEGDHHSN